MDWELTSASSSVAAIDEIDRVGTETNYVVNGAATNIESVLANASSPRSRISARAVFQRLVADYDDVLKKLAY